MSLIDKLQPAVAHCRRPPWRAAGTALLLLAVGIAVVCNAGRIFILARIAYDEGKDAMDAAHDGVGFWVLILTYGGISLAAWGLGHVAAGKRSVVRKVAREPVE